MVFLLAAPSFIISFVQQLYSSDEKKQLSWRTSNQPPPLSGRWIIFFCIFSSVSSSTITLSDNMGLAWVWPVGGVFFLSIFYHHFIISLRAAVE